MAYKNKKDLANWYLKNKEQRKWKTVFNTYSLTKEEFYNLLDKQNSQCAICGVFFLSLDQKHLHIDHDHETDKVRGLLCKNCNIGLGMLGDNEEGISRALQYVKGELN
ncbi:MAG TPA: endonuclease VII domain-containing protein [Rhabdochlamydiaceae bacterium]|jgi:hypothetical protein